MEVHSIDFEELPKGAPFGASLAAGALAGIAEHTLIFPLDSIKTRLQVLTLDPAARYSGPTDAFRKILSTEGAGRLWRGVFSVIAGAGPAHAVYFAVYEQVKTGLGVGGEGEAASSSWKASLAGASATTTADAVMNPFDVVKQRLQMRHSPYSGFRDCFVKIFRSEGLAAFYRSYPATLVLNIPFHVVHFPLYEKLRAYFTDKTLNRPQPVAHLMAGGIAGGVAGFFTTPIDVIKTTLQTTNHRDGRVSGMLSAGQTVWREYGAGGFFRGAVPRTMSFIPSTAICWTCYEYFKRAIVSVD